MSLEEKLFNSDHHCLLDEALLPYQNKGDGALWSPWLQPWQSLADRVSAQKPQEQAKTASAACDQLPPRSDGKEGFDGSSPSEALQKPRKAGAFSLLEIARL